MRTYCAFLRGVNIGGKTMKMAEACDVLKAAGFVGVIPVLATGNIVFKSDRPQNELRSCIEQVLSEHYKDSVFLFIKTKEEISAMLLNVPFEENSALHVYTFICEPEFETILIEEFRKITPSEQEDAKVSGGSFYWQCRKGATLDSGFSKILGRKNMKDKFTSRNINTLSKIIAKM